MSRIAKIEMKNKEHQLTDSNERRKKTENEMNIELIDSLSDSNCRLFQGLRITV